MTPTLIGRWQTRLLMFLIVGIPVTVLFSVPTVAVAGFIILPIVLVCVVAVGLALDVVYDRIQQRRWDHDWPVHLQVWAGVLEFVCAGILLLPLWVITAGVALLIYPFHYLAVWLLSFAILQGPIQIILPRWRFTGGRVRSSTQR